MEIKGGLMTDQGLFIPQVAPSGLPQSNKAFTVSA